MALILQVQMPTTPLPHLPLRRYPGRLTKKQHTFIDKLPDIAIKIFVLLAIDFRELPGGHPIEKFNGEGLAMSLCKFLEGGNSGGGVDSYAEQ